MRTTLMILTTLALAMFLLGCPPREHLRKDYGKEVRARFAKQQVFLVPAEKNPQGLDSEEAAAIHGKYRRSLTGSGGGRAQQPQILLLETKKKGK